VNGYRVAAVISANCVEGSLVLVAHAVGGIDRLDGIRGLVAMSIWQEGDDALRMSLRNAASDTVAYVQGGRTLIALARELGMISG
jgi:hypothetical protein